jgi:hypothetical protein
MGLPGDKLLSSCWQRQLLLLPEKVSYLDSAVHQCSSGNSGPLDKKILFRDHVDFIRIMKDGSILVVNRKNFFVWEVDENHESELLGVKSAHCDELMEVALAEMGTK